MFDNIRFSTYYTKQTLTGANMRELNPFGGEEPDYIIRGSLFAISGNIKSLPAIPVSEHTMEHSYYVQTFSVMTCDEKYYTKRKDCNSYLILYTYEGEGVLEYEGRSYPQKPGDGFFIDCRKPHFYKTAGSKWIHSDLHFRGKPMGSVYEEYCSINGPAFREPVTGKYQNMLEKLAVLLSVFSPYREFQISNLLSNIVTHILVSTSENAREGQSVPQNLRYLIQYMENHYFRELSLDFLASFSGISKFHLSREFHKYMGCPPKEYIIRLRMQNARFLLENTDMPAGRIAGMIGMKSESSFVQTFKKRVGATPGEYRKKYTHSGPLDAEELE